MEENTWCLKPSSQQDRARGQLLAAVARALALAEGERLEAGWRRPEASGTQGEGEDTKHKPKLREAASGRKLPPSL